MMMNRPSICTVMHYFMCVLMAAAEETRVMINCTLIKFLFVCVWWWWWWGGEIQYFLIKGSNSQQWSLARVMTSSSGLL
jgi:hypothetical protein